MSIERFILITIVIFATASFIYIPKGQVRKAILSFLAFQATTWFAANILVQNEIIAFPVREFTKASQIAFIPNFLLYPTVFTWFILLYPHHASKAVKLLHWFIFISIDICFIYFTTVYTAIEDIRKGTLASLIRNNYWSFALQYLLCYLYINWFYQKKAAQRE